MQDPCTQSFSRWIRNFHTCPDLARRSTVSSDFLFFPSIYTYYIYYIPVMKISCDVSGDAAVSSRTGMITGANTVGLPPLTRGCGRDGEKRGRSRGKERKGGKERHLSISFNPTFPCRLLLSIYYKLFCRSPRGAACPTDGENTRAFHSIKFDKVRRRCTEGGEGYPREFPVIAKSKMARVRARYRTRYRWHACRYYHSRDGDSFRDLSIECIEFPCSILNSVNALVRFVPRKFATSLRYRYIIEENDCCDYRCDCSLISFSYLQIRACCLLINSSVEFWKIFKNRFCIRIFQVFRMRICFFKIA